MLKKIFNLENNLTEALENLRDCRNNGPNDKTLTKLYFSLKNIYFPISEAQSIVFNLIKDKFNLLLPAAIKGCNYYREVYKKENIVFCSFLMNDDNHKLFFLCREGCFTNLSHKEFLDSPTEENRFICTVQEINIAIHEEWDDWQTIKNLLQNSNKQILFIDDSFKEEFEKDFKKYF